MVPPPPDTFWSAVLYFTLLSFTYVPSDFLVSILIPSDTGWKDPFMEYSFVVFE